MPGDDMPTYRLVRIELDERSLARASADIEHERKIAIYDMLQDNMFRPIGDEDVIGTGPFVLYLSNAEGRLLLDIRREDEMQVRQLHLSLSPLRRTIKDYFILCESYYDAIRNAAPEKIEPIDMARRATHNEASDILIERLKGKVEIDFNTARRLFTLICSLHMRPS